MHRLMPPATMPDTVLFCCSSWMGGGMCLSTQYELLAQSRECLRKAASWLELQGPHLRWSTDRTSRLQAARLACTLYVPHVPTRCCHLRY